MKTVAEHQKNINPWKRNIVADLDAPQYYSKNAIYAFSILPITGQSQSGNP